MSEYNPLDQILMHKGIEPTREAKLQWIRENTRIETLMFMSPEEILDFYDDPKYTRDGIPDNAATRLKYPDLFRAEEKKSKFSLSSLALLLLAVGVSATTLLMSLIP